MSSAARPAGVKSSGENVLETTPQRISGRIKWFDGTRGFGFILSDDGGPDILLHANVLRNFGQSSIAEAAVIEAEVQTTQRGLQVTEVLRIDAPEENQDAASGRDDAVPQPEPNTPLEPARMKWFDKAKGFGFANVFGSSDDIFVHMEVLRRCGMAELMPGEAICVKVADGPRGKMAVEVQSWDRVEST